VWCWLRWIKRIQEILQSGQTSLSINGNITPYFKCKKGLRQGDSLSPFLFNLVADSLSKILTKVKIAGYIAINLNFADDTLIFLKADSKMIDALKMVLLGFENFQV
jgi:Reverse transcriptase (RNA-dependent DNA polymerase)